MAEAKQKSDKELAREKRKVRQTPEFRVSFPNVFVPQKADEAGGKDKYNLVMLFPKKTDIAVLKKAAFAAAVEKWGAKDKWPKGLVFPFKDGDDKSDLPGYAGTNTVTASSTQKPAVVGGRKDSEGKFLRLEPQDFYPGCYAVASIEAIAYEYSKVKNGPVLKRGVMFQLSGVQKKKDGESFIGRRAPEEDFEEFEDGSDDAASFEDTDATDNDIFS